MDVTNLSWKNEINRNNNPLLSKNIRGIIVGKSGCGKTTLLCNLLLQPNWLHYNKLMVYSKRLNKPVYNIMQKAFELRLSKEDIFKGIKNSNAIINSGVNVDYFLKKWATGNSDIDAEFVESSDEVYDPSDLDANNKNLMVFDDLMLKKQNACEKYYVRGRHNNVDCFYLSQNYFKLPRQSIRENANFFCLFPQDGKNLSDLHQDHMTGDMRLQEFKDFCYKGWQKPHDFITLDLSSSRNNGRYRHGLDEFYIPYTN